MADVEKLVGTESPLEVGQKINEIIEKGVGSGHDLFDLIEKDHILTYEESKGLALLGTYVYKEAIAGSRYGYPDFYNKVIEEYENSTPTTIEGAPIALPTFTDNTTDGITISDSRDNTTNLQLLFNNALTNTGDVIDLGAWSTYWINIDYGQPTILKSYRICSDNSGTAESPTAWTLEGSNNGVDFDVLGTYTGEDWVEVSLIRAFTNGASFSQTKAYSQYRLVFSAGVESSSNGQLSFVDFSAVKAVEVSKNSNEHLFYDIANKDAVDEAYDTYGVADLYGVDTANERIFLPRKLKPKRVLVRSKKPTDSDSRWYNLYSDGWLEQGGWEMGTSVAQKTSRRIKFLLPFADVTYTANVTQVGVQADNSVSASGIVLDTLTTAGLRFYHTGGAYGVVWTAEGYSTETSLKSDYTYMCVGNTETKSTITDVVDVTTTENDTIPLFTAQYFDFTPNNVSWLKGGEQTNSGGIYEFAYNELVKVLNGETKYGDLKVVDVANMVSGEDYSLYWKVDQDALSFTCPIRTGERVLIDKKEPTDDNTTWYNLYSDGWLEQGGQDTTIAYNNTTEITLPKAYKDVNYMALTGYIEDSSHNVASAWVTHKTTTTIRLKGGYHGGSLTVAADWYTEGYTNITANDFKLNTIYFKVANAVENLELLDAGAVMEAVADKISRQDCKAYVTETYQNGQSGYIIYSNGYCEQWGYIPNSPTGVVSVTFLKKFVDANYNLVGGVIASASGNTSFRASGIGYNLTTDGFTAYIGTEYPKNWRACGYLAEGEY